MSVVNIVVTNPDAQDSGTSGNFTFTYIEPAPVVSSITPNTGTNGGGTAITDLHGTDFQNGATVTIGGVACTSVVFVDATQLTCVTPDRAGVGALDVVVTNPDTQDSGSSGAGLWTGIASPLISSVSQPSGTSLGGDSLTISGTGLGSLGGGSTVTIGGVSATVTGGFGGITLSVTTGAGTPGLSDVVVTYLGVDSGITGDGLFTYIAPPVVSAITPNTGIRGGGTAVAIDGTDFVNGATVTIDGISAASVVWVNSTQLTCIIPADINTGAVDVIVTNPSTLTSGTSGNGLYTYTAGPFISSISQPTGSHVGGTSITITGQGLCAMFGGGATVTVGGVSATVNSGFGGINVQITTPAGSVGPADIVLTYLGVSTGISGNGRFTYT